jgi:hypothetical protein
MGEGGRGVSRGAQQATGCLRGWGEGSTQGGATQPTGNHMSTGRAPSTPARAHGPDTHQLRAWCASSAAASPATPAAGPAVMGRLLKAVEAAGCV